MTLKKNSLKKLKGLYAVIDPGVCALAKHSPLPVVKACLEAGVKVIQLRYKAGSDTELLFLAGKIKKECEKHGALFIMNDRADLARLAKADGLHLGQKDLPVRIARKIFKGLIGISTHNDKEIQKALKEKVDYIGFGPVFATSTKKGLPPAAGLGRLKRAVLKANIPVAAIGGINKDNIRKVLLTGASCAAVISAVCAAKSPKRAIKQLTKYF